MRSVVEVDPGALPFIPTKGEDVTQARQIHLFLGIGTVSSRMILGRKVIGGGPFGWRHPKHAHRSCHCGPKSSPHSSISWSWSVSLSPDWVNFTNTLQWWAEWRSQRYVRTLISGTPKFYLGKGFFLCVFSVCLLFVFGWEWSHACIWKECFNEIFWSSWILFAY